ncbi:uncharacterized protein LOC129589944 [Paramacrobiotus metropolitanus]|uniref:uncharacterized protein LOC129589944 n=1 Tax=Paramacrobiotus metropolitanus TaxID=2943436 RepID=UPI002445BB1F|nr:uncharacterized protein LOC129589944 [Paramacrobiotus metropolitanus]
MADPFASAFEPSFSSPAQPNFSPRPSISGFPVAPNQVLAVWSVTAPEKAKSDQIFLTIDTDQDGLINGGECKGIFLQSGLPPPMLAHIWTLCDIKKNGMLNAEQFALAFHLIHQKVKSNTDPPTALSPDLVPPSMRQYSTQFPVPGVTGPLEDSEEGGDEDLKKEIKALEEEIKGIRADRAQLVQDVESRKAEVLGRQTELQNMTKELEQLQTAAKQLDFQRGEAQKRLDDLDAQKLRLQSTHTALTAEIQAEREKTRELRGEIERRQRGQKDEELEASQKKAELERLKREEATLAQKLDHQRAQMASLEVAVREGDGRIGQIEEHMATLAAMNASLRDAITQFDAALASNDTSGINHTYLHRPLSDFTFNAGLLNFQPISAAPTFPVKTPVTSAFDDPFRGEDPFASSAASTTIVSDDPWGASPFGAFAADPFGGGGGGFPPESPLPALPPKKSALTLGGAVNKQPPPRPAPPKAGKKEGSSPARDAFESDPWGAGGGADGVYAFPGFEQPQASSFATDFDDFGNYCNIVLYGISIVNHRPSQKMEHQDEVPSDSEETSTNPKKNQKRKSDNSSDTSPTASRRDTSAETSSGKESAQKMKKSNEQISTNPVAQPSAPGSDDEEMPALLDPWQMRELALAEPNRMKQEMSRERMSERIATLQENEEAAQRDALADMPPLMEPGAAGGRARGIRIISVSTGSDEEEGPNADDLPDLLSPGDSDRMEVSDDEDEDEARGDAQSDNPILWHTPADPHELIAPLPPLSPRQSLPALLLWKELNPFPAALQLRQKLASHRDLVQRLGLYATLDHHTGCVNALNFNPAGTLLASGSDDLEVGVWDWMQKKLKYSFPSGHNANVFQTKFLPLSNDSLIVTASRDGGVRLAELSMAGGRPKIRHLCRHHGACHKIDVRADAHYHILTSGEDAVVNYIDVREAKARKCVVVRDSKSSKVPLYSIMSNPLNAHEFVVSGYGKYVRAYDMRKLDSDPSKCQPILSLCPPLLQPKSSALSVSSAVYNYNGSEILATYNDFHIFLFKNCADETVATVDLQHYEGHRNNQTVKGVNFYGAKSEYVVSGSDCGRVFFWDKETARIVHYLMADEIGAVNVLEPHPRDPYFATSGLEHTAKIWAPLNDEPANLEDLIPIIDKNSNERKRDAREMGNHSAREERFFMMLMNHIARRANRANRDNNNDNEDNAPEEAENDSDESEGDADVQVGRVRCGTN